MRVLVAGMGGELGSRIAQLLEERSDVSEIAGLDFVPPRRRLRRSVFRRFDLGNLEAVAEFVEECTPEVVVHAGIYEPNARSSPSHAVERSTNTTVAVLGAAARAGALRHIIVRSGIEVYPRGRGQPMVPDEMVPPDPGSGFGRICLEAERLAVSTGRRLDIPVTALRLAPVVGSHLPSPLGRLLRLPVVPVAALSDPPFTMLHGEDAARAFAQATRGDRGGPLNVVGPGAATPWQAVRLGGRVPLPVVGPSWVFARRAAEFAGAPIPGHVLELLTRGRAADGTRAVEVLGLGDLKTAHEILAELFEWASVTPLRDRAEEVA